MRIGLVIEVEKGVLAVVEIVKADARAFFTLQLRGIAETIIFRRPLNTYGIKPYIGVAAGWWGVESRHGELYNQFSYSPVFGLRYYPIDRWGLLVEWGETFNGATGLNVGVSYGGRK